MELVFSGGGKPERFQCRHLRLENAAMRAPGGELVATFSDHAWLRGGTRYGRIFCRQCASVLADGRRRRAGSSVTLSGASLFVDGRLFAIYNPEVNRWTMARGRALVRAIELAQD